MIDGILLTDSQEHALLFAVVMGVFPVMTYYLRKMTIIIGNILLKLERMSTIVESCPYCQRKFEEHDHKND